MRRSTCDDEQEVGNDGEIPFQYTQFGKSHLHSRSGARVREKVSDIESQLLPSSLYPMLQISVFFEHFEITVLEKLNRS